MKAIILAAGLGKRMRPLTDSKPKPMITVGGKCLIDHVLDWLAAAGIEETVVNTHYLAQQLEDHLLSRDKAPHIMISREETLLETGGGIARALPMLGDSPFFAVNSDAICQGGKIHPLKRLEASWRDEAMDALLLLQPVADAVGYEGAGDFSLSQNGAVIRRNNAPSAPYVFTGIQMLHPRLFKSAPAGAFSLNILYDQGKKTDGTLPRIFALIHDGKWLHVGDPAAIALAESHLQ